MPAKLDLDDSHEFFTLFRFFFISFRQLTILEAILFFPSFPKEEDRSTRIEDRDLSVNGEA